MPSTSDPRWLEECYRVLKPGGKLLVATWTHRTCEAVTGGHQSNEGLSKKERRLLDKICKYYALPEWVQLKDYTTIANKVRRLLGCGWGGGCTLELNHSSQDQAVGLPSTIRNPTDGLASPTVCGQDTSFDHSVWRGCVLTTVCGQYMSFCFPQLFTYRQKCTSAVLHLTHVARIRYQAVLSFQPRRHRGNPPQTQSRKPRILNPRLQLGFKEDKTGDWSASIGPFWPAVWRTALTWKGVCSEPLPPTTPPLYCLPFSPTPQASDLPSSRTLLRVILPGLRCGSRSTSVADSCTAPRLYAQFKGLLGTLKLGFATLLGARAVLLMNRGFKKNVITLSAFAFTKP